MSLVQSAVAEFVQRDPTLSDSGIDVAAGLVFDGVRFSPYYGYTSFVRLGDLLFQVSVDSDDPSVVSFTNMSNRLLLDKCGNEPPVGTAYLTPEAASEITGRFLSAHGLTELLRSLSQERSALGCFGTEEYYQFVWRERYEDGIAKMIARIEVMVNPLDGGVYSLKAAISKPETEDLAPEVCVRGLSLSGYHNQGWTTKRIALFSNHYRDGTTREAWAATLSSESGECVETVVVVDARSGEILGN